MDIRRAWKRRRRAMIPYVYTHRRGNDMTFDNDDAVNSLKNSFVVTTTTGHARC